MSTRQSGSDGGTFGASDGRVLMVLSHPNHEAAVFGLVQRLRPRLVMLTDGGGEARVEQSRRALDRIGLLERASFLNFRESDFYRALLDRELSFFRKVAGRLREEIAASRPEQVLCDAVEFYNPVHDLALPALYAALGKNRDIPIFEMPLIYQTVATQEAYEIQRFPASRSDHQILFRLGEEKLRVKLQMFNEVYDLLRLQIGDLLSSLPADHLATEVIAPAVSGPASVSNEITLRYEWRARSLMERGVIERMITYADHYLPMAEALTHQFHY